MTDAVTPPDLSPVDLSDEARQALMAYARGWAGWSQATVIFGPTDPAVSPWATTDLDTHTMTFNIDALLLNPHRVLHTVNPFRMRQEAVLTGAMLHEAGHARYSDWLRKAAKRAESKKGLVHRGPPSIPVTAQTLRFARILEEPRIEGAMLASGVAGADTYGWTLQAMVAHLLPMTDLPDDPAEAVMAAVTSWVLRAGRAWSRFKTTNAEVPGWFNEFSAVVSAFLVEWFTACDLSEADGPTDPDERARRVMNMLRVAVGDMALPAGLAKVDKGDLLDTARDILDLMFPETEPEDVPMPPAVCGTGGDIEPESGSDAPAGAGGTPAPEQGDETAEQTPGDAEQGSEDDAEADAKAQALREAMDETLSKMAQDLIEAETKAETEESGEAEQSKKGAGAGPPSVSALGYRAPTAAERDIAKAAEKFLRDLVNPTESRAVHLSESPAPAIDAAAYEAWRASSMVTEPRFFRRTRRTVTPQPPVKIAVLVDVSSSMEVLADPSAVLSWALASAATDMSNFAGRGQQIHSTLIHWGSAARVILADGQQPPGVKLHRCKQGTYAMGEALELVEEQMPGFFDAGDAPENRLLVQFTDWDLLGGHYKAASWLGRGLDAGVNMLSVVPAGDHRAVRDHNHMITRSARFGAQRGTATTMAYNKADPGAVWSAAANVLAQG